jgi:hypothetical protein
MTAYRDFILGFCSSALVLYIMVTTLNWPNNIDDKLSKKTNEIIFPAFPLFKWHCILYLI